jgi:hypothetical protein
MSFCPLLLGSAHEMESIPLTVKFQQRYPDDYVWQSSIILIRAVTDWNSGASMAETPQRRCRLVVTRGRS